MPFSTKRFVLSVVTAELALNTQRTSSMKLSLLLLLSLLLSLLSVASRSTPAADAVGAAGTSRSERGALKILYWATQGPAWKQRWDIQNEMSDPCVNNVSRASPGHAACEANGALTVLLVCLLLLHTVVRNRVRSSRAHQVHVSDVTDHSCCLLPELGLTGMCIWRSNQTPGRKQPRGLASTRVCAPRSPISERTVRSLTSLRVSKVMLTCLHIKQRPELQLPYRPGSRHAVAAARTAGAASRPQLVYWPRPGVAESAHSSIAPVSSSSSVRGHVLAS